MAPRAKTSKSPASLRTVDMFSGLTQEEIDRERVAQAQEDAKEAPREPAKTIEEQADGWRAKSFEVCQELETISKRFPKENFLESGEPGSVFRITTKEPYMFLEQFKRGVNGLAWGWTGVMFRSADLNEITNVFVREAKRRANDTSK